MKVTLPVFRTAVQILQTNTLDEVSGSLKAVRNHLSVLNENFETQKDLLTRTIAFYKKHEREMNWRKQNINANQLSTWIPLFKRHKEASTFNDVKAATVTKIIQSKKEIDKIDLSISELKLRLKEFARSGLEIQSELKKTETQIFVLEQALKIADFFTFRNYDPKGIAEYEYEKYLELYRRAGNENG